MLNSIRMLVSVIGWLALWPAVSVQPALAQSGKLEQVRNGTAASPNSPVIWVNGNVGSSNAHYLENMSASYRYVITGLSPGTHTFTIEYDIKKGQRHTFDYLTHFNRVEPHAAFNHPPEIIDPLSGHPGVDPTPITYPIPVPPSSKLVACTGQSQPDQSFNNLKPLERLMTMFNGTTITDIKYLNIPDLNQPGGMQQMQVTFTTIDSKVIFAWGAHLASGADWCPLFSVAGISGSSYHMNIAELDGGGGGQDRSISALAVIPLPPCGIDGPDTVCPGSLATYTVGAYIGYTYTWEIANNSSGAFFVGGNTGDSVIVNTGSAHESFTLRVAMETAGYSDTCTKTVSIVAPELTAISIPFACVASPGGINLIVAGGMPPYTYQWSHGATTEDPAALTAGTYTVTVQDAQGCNETTSVIVGSLPVLTASASAGPVSCAGYSDGSASASAAGGTAPFTFLWSTGAGSMNVAGLSGGTYTATITDANGCTFTTSATVQEPAALAISTTTSYIPCRGEANGAIATNVSGGTPPYAYAWSNGLTAQQQTGLTAGTYTLTVTDANGCSETKTAMVTQPSSALTAAIIAAQPVQCHGGGDGFINLSPAGGMPPYSFAWSTGDTSQNAAGLAAGSYSVTITDANGCTVTQTATITEPAALNPVLSGIQQVNCFSGLDGTIDLTVAGGTPPYAFLWSHGETTEDVSGLPAGNYFVAITDANGCSDTLTAQVNQPSALAATVNVQHVNCFGDANGAINLSVSQGTPPYSYAWSTGDTTEDLSILTPGTYAVTVTDANGCAIDQSAVISQPISSLQAHMASLQDIDCFNGSGAVLSVAGSGGTGPYQFQWSNGNTTQQIGNLSAGQYAVTITDANGCTAMQPGLVMQPPPLVVAVSQSQHILCHGDTNGMVALTVAGGTPPYACQWNNGITGMNLNGLMGGTYAAIVTDDRGCTETVSVTVSQPTAPLAVSASGQSVACYGDANGAISLTVTQGTPPYAFLWNTGATTEDIFNLAPGAYSVTVTDAGGCTAVQSATISQPAVPLTASGIANPNVSCYGGSNGSIDLTFSGGTPPYIFAWSHGATTTNVTGLQAGTYTVLITDANGCTATATTTVSQPLPSVSIAGSATQANCLHQFNGSITVQITAGTGPFSYLWSNSAVTQNLTSVPAGAYTVTVTESTGCTTTGTFTVGDISEFNASASGPATVCAGDLVTLVADSIPGAAYQWYLNGMALVGSVQHSFATPAAGSYSVTINHACGNFISDSIRVTVTAPQNIALSPNVIICPGESTTLQVSGGSSYVWSPAMGLNTAFSATPIATPSQTTLYRVEVTDESGCKTTGEVLISVLCDSLVIPSGYSPNGDGQNDAFEIPGIDAFPGNKIWIYNRWGALVFKTRDYSNDWRGQSNVNGVYFGNRLPNGTYYYLLDLNNGAEPKTGYVVLKK